MRCSCLFGMAFVASLAACSGSSDQPAGSGSGGAGGAAGTSGSGGSAGSAGAAGGLDVELSTGKIHGASAGGVNVFRGIPYAEPPVGALRWKAPEKKAPWSGVLDASKLGPQCPQLDATGTFLQGTEDCLTLDVWTPATAPAAPRPVMVWIHGGGFYSGSGTDATYQGTHLVPAGDVVLVDINYRLGALGFLAHAWLTAEDTAHASSGNYGFEDQQLALQWVQHEISAFGGDPGNVTIFGESAGGISVCSHLTAPASQGLFQRAIVESGPCSLVTDTLATAEAQGDQLAKAVSCSDLACLRGKTAEQVVRALPLKQGIIFGTGASWAPNIDGSVLPQAPGAVIDAGAQSKVPVVMGTNSEEGELFVLLGGMTGIDDAQYTATVTAVAAAQGVDAQKILAEYPSSSFPTPADAFAAILTDAVFVCPTRHIARALSKTSDVYLYDFRHPIQLLGVSHVYHAAELPFVFQSTLVTYTPAGSEIDLSNAMMGYWTRFGASGDPNGAGAVSWPKYDLASEQHLVLDLTQSVGSGLKQAECDFWDAL